MGSGKDAQKEGQEEKTAGPVDGASMSESRAVREGQRRRIDAEGTATKRLWRKRPSGRAWTRCCWILEAVGQRETATRVSEGAQSARSAILLQPAWRHDAAGADDPPLRGIWGGGRPGSQALMGEHRERDKRCKMQRTRSGG